LTVGFDFTDLKRQFTLTLANGVLNQSGRGAANTDARLVLSKAGFDRLQSGQTTLEKAIEAGEIKVEGRREAASELLGLLDTFPFWFNIVTP
jgi:alkyl sulfatase BDS1-like metallo-beta-lactamase superfamily hydrolase